MEDVPSPYWLQSIRKRLTVFENNEAKNPFSWNLKLKYLASLLWGWLFYIEDQLPHGNMSQRRLEHTYLELVYCRVLSEHPVHLFYPLLALDQWSRYQSLHNLVRKCLQTDSCYTRLLHLVARSTNTKTSPKPDLSIALWPRCAGLSVLPHFLYLLCGSTWASSDSPYCRSL